MHEGLASEVGFRCRRSVRDDEHQYFLVGLPSHSRCRLKDSGTVPVVGPGFQTAECELRGITLFAVYVQFREPVPLIVGRMAVNEQIYVRDG